MAKVTALGMDTITEKSGHQMTGMAVSVCLTPAAPSPVPIPYPTMGTVAEGIIDPCMRTKIEGAKILTVGGCMKACHGNEPGTLKEIVSLNTAGPCFPWLGAPNVLIELGMAGITGSMGQMNKSITAGAGATASGAGGSGAGGGGAGGSAGGPAGGGPQGARNAGGGGGGSNTGSGPPSPPASPKAEGQASGGHPVDVATGTMFTAQTVDFVLPGLFYVQWDRAYRSSNVARRAGIGWGWSHSLHYIAERQGDWLLLTDDELRTTPIRMPAEDQFTRLPFGRNVVRFGDGIGIDCDDGLLRVLMPDAAHRTYRLAQLRDGHGNVATVTWGGEEVVAITDTCNRRAELTRDGRIKSWRLTASDAEGREHQRTLVVYELDERGDLVRVVDMGGVEWRYEYDEEHYLVREIQPDGVIYHFQYELVGGQKRCVETWGELVGQDILNALGAPEAGDTGAPRGIYHTRFRYGLDPLETAMMDGAGHVHRYRVNPLGQVLQYIDPRGYARDYRYDDSGRLLSSTDGAGRTRRRQYDVFGRLTGIVKPGGAALRRRYDDGARQSITIYEDGARTIQREGERGRIEQLDEAGRVTTWRMNAAGLVTQVDHPGGATETFSYDAHANLVRHVDTIGITFEYTWDLWGRPVRIRGESGQTYELFYDSRNEIAEIVEENGRRTTFVTDAMRQLIEERTTEGAITTSRYVAGVLVERIRPDGGRFRFGYDGLLRLRWIENPAGERYVREYDASGNIARETTFAGITTEYEVDGANQIAALARDGLQIRFTRDEEDRIIEKEFSTGRRERFRYDRRGGLLCAEVGGVSVSYERDPEGRVLREVQEASGWRYAVEYRYDELGTLVERKYSTGWSVGFVRRPEDGQPTRMSLVGSDAGLAGGDPGRAGTGAALPCLEFAYDARGWEIERRRLDAPCCVATDRDPFGLPTLVRLLDAKGAERQARAFEWSRLGPLARIIDAQRGSRRYTLDVMGRPVEAEGLDVRERFTYAPQGTAVPADVPFALGRDGRPIANGRARLSWDSAGRLAARHADEPLQSWQYRYDENNQLIRAVRGDGLEIRYLYDPFGRRLAVGFNDGTSVWFGWDGNSIVEELPSSGAPVRRVFADDGFTPLLESGPDGAWQLVLTDAAAAPWLYAAPDLQCSTIEMSTWGEVASRTGQPGQLRFAGQRADELTGLHYNRHRYYAPDLHVFLTPDPLALLSTLQDVGYVPNPTIFIDPLGLLTIINGSPGDPVMEDTIRQMKAQYPDAKVIRSDKLGKSPSIWQRLSGTGKSANMIDSNENHVFVTTHGAPGRAQWKGKKGGYATGDEIGMQLNKAGFKGKGARVDTTICNGATPGENDAPSITQGIANQTGATVWGALADDPGAARRGTPMTKHPITFVKPRPWYNFWSPTAKQSDGSDFVIEDKEYITDKQGHLYYGTMSGTPNNPTVHGGKYVPTAPKR
ncbi:PAAR-like domain-containing protein [Sorangium sp. So ce363]|uniref:PAAR-like domain-containing protein n=1 Tax=Sorangium sp. So ce363 TaxID=3133304 RepID=UPI003F618704